MIMVNIIMMMMTRMPVYLQQSERHGDDAEAEVGHGQVGYEHVSGVHYYEYGGSNIIPTKRYDEQNIETTAL